ncbi:FAD-dependent monooxygenase [Actinomadura rubrisoli]|uniref:FAD-dependent oxidoreductase n=1 Tax=Actinomadura rubrisoli TaxID=2530368 RepID=A0A4V2YXH1_9ACTN|nr:FAD-dependent monooxygenase [Actinomadura rubrisoli]TDD88857.1 FAD-dependent oxidoreductase [Actinomadura rubrisoli]
MTTENILISGASVAGPALAYWLAGYGFTPTIVEQAPALRDGGYAVDFRGEVHLGLLRRMGILGPIVRAKTDMGATTYVNAAGKKLASMPADLFAGDVEVLRGDLAQILYKASAPRAEYIFGDSIASMTETRDGVDVTFEHGPPRRFDLVIGADGFHSNVRSIAFGREEKFASHLGLYCAIFTLDNFLALDHASLAYNTPGKLVILNSARANTEAKVVFYFASPLIDHDRHDAEAQKTILAERFAGIGWETDRILDAMGDAPDFYFDSVGQINMDAWSRGRVALIGDAACCPSPVSGMGTGLAVVAAYVLAGELAAAGGDHRVAFPRYEEALRPYARRCQKQGEGAARFMAPESRFMSWLMNQNYRLMPYLPGKGLIAKSARKTAEGIELREYPPCSEVVTSP